MESYSVIVSVQYGLSAVYPSVVTGYVKIFSFFHEQQITQFACMPGSLK